VRLEKKMTTTYTMVHDDGTVVTPIERAKIERLMKVIDKGWLRSNSSTAALSNNSRLGIVTELLIYFKEVELLKEVMDSVEPNSVISDLYEQASGVI